MKTITIKLLLMAIPVIMMACNSSQNRNKDNKNVSNTMKNDSVSKSAVLVDNNNDQNSDQDFITEAANGGLLEVELGKYAQEHATNPRVKNFGAMIVKDHSKANEELMSLAAKKNINMAATMDDKHREMMIDIQKKTGADFDKAYMKDMVDDHEKDVDKFKKHAENGVDSDLKAFASKTLPVLIMHGDSAKKIRDAIE